MSSLNSNWEVPCFASLTAGVSEIYFFFFYFTFFDGTTMTQAGWTLMKSKLRGLMIGLCFGVLGVTGYKVVKAGRFSSSRSFWGMTVSPGF